MRRNDCRVCRGRLVTRLDLGDQPLANALLPTFDAECAKYPLLLTQCVDCELVQLGFDIPPEVVFRNSYPLFSSTGSRYWLDHAAQLTEDIWLDYQLNSNSVVMEIGSNDGYLLRNLLGACQVVGVEPGVEQACCANLAGVPTINTFFGPDELPQADIIIAINTMAQIPDLNQFADRLRKTLKLEGTAIIEVPDLVHTIAGVQFDQIYHEHYSYFSVTALANLFERHKLVIYDAEPLPTHGGSLRLYVGHYGRHELKAEAAHLQWGEDFDWSGFVRDVARVKTQSHALRALEVEYGNVWAYGAAAKGNTYLNFCGIDFLDIRGVADLNPHKIGKYLPGSRIEIVSEDTMLAHNPKHILLLAWNWADEAKKRLRERGYEGKFITAVPRMVIE